MHLRTLTLRGFKSFARSTTMRFEPGINCVVGPNGSGKSNVVDALSWVMGEQGVKNLRGGSMADVIFAGTSKRPALGRAEVSLTIDNTDGALPIEYSEVTITRTLFRSGGSEYAINGTACRLLDIQDLLSDTGMGREMHVIIGQGRLDEVLTATAEDRRGFIEEAAGVLKHRKRKERALRKIEAMAGSFTRIEDLSAELRRQLGPLAKQAEAARRAQVIQAEVRDARARILADDVAQLQSLMTAGFTNEARIAKERAANREAVETVRAELQELEERAGEADPYRAQLNEQWERLSSLEERFRSLGQLAGERHRSLSAGAHSAFHGERPEDILVRADKARSEEEALQADIAAAGDALTAAIAAREQLEAAERAIEREHAELTRTVADQREEAARLAGQIQAASSRLEALTAETSRVHSSIVAATERAESTALQCQQLEQDVVAGSEGNDSLAGAHEKSAAALEAAIAARDDARVREQEAREALTRWKATASTLELSLAPEDATAWAREQFPQLGLVRDTLRVAAGWESAVEAALDGIAVGVVASDVGAAVDVLRAARAAGAGHLEIAVSGELPPQDDRVIRALTTVSADSADAVAALDAVEVTGDADIRSLLSDVVLAADLGTARSLIEAGAPIVATRGGDILTAHAARGGEVNASSLLARQSAFDEAQQAATAAAHERELAAEALAAAETVVAGAREEHERTGSELTAQDSRLAAAAAQLGILRQNLAAARDEVARGEKRLAALAEETAERRERVELLRTRQEALGTEPQELAARVAAVAAQRDTAHTHTQDARVAETEARLHLRTREERLRAIAGRADSLVRNAEALADRIRREELAAARRSAAAAVAEEVGDYATRALRIASGLRQRIGQERAEAEASRTQVDAELSGLRRRLDELVTAGRALDDQSHQRELAAAELRLRHEQLAATSLEVLGMDAETLVSEYGPDRLIPVATESDDDVVGNGIPYVRSDQEKRLAKAERDMARLGRINPLALEEHAALEERQKYLAGQLADLKKSRDDLLHIVRDLDERLDDVLRSALDDVVEKFSDVFERLFPGGEGRLILTDPDSPLTTGIEIEARPPGKRVKRLSLLSGGERSLTALAFLVAIFMARPSPFYVMDEVEAALDDVNLSRLLDIFRDLKGNSQLLVVTHQKRTMEIADTIYGISMREDGVTGVVSQRMADVAP